MQRYAQAWIQRISQQRALARAQTFCQVWQPDIKRNWDDGLCELLPSDRTVSIPDLSHWLTFSVWMPQGEKIDWLRAELFWRMLGGCQHRLLFEVVGNESQIRFYLKCHQSDSRLLQTVFAALYPKAALAAESIHWWRDRTLQAYAECLGVDVAQRITLFESLPDSPLWVLCQELLELPLTAVGFVQCVFQPFGPTDNWHRQIEAVHDLAFLSRLSQPLNAWQRMSQPLPSGELRHRSEELLKKANPDQPFFGVSLRGGVFDCSDRHPLSFLNAFRLNGTALVAKEQPLPDPRWHDAIFQAGITCRQGLLFNSGELASLIHPLPAKEELRENCDWPVFRQDVDINHTETEGSLIGHARMANQSVPIYIPAEIRARGTHVISATGMGKTTLLKSLFLQDVMAGWGAVYLDPHGDAIHDLMGVLPKSEHSRCIYFNPGDPDWVALWNPLHLTQGEDIYRLADDMLSSLERISHDWGDRLATVLRHALVGLLHLPSATMHDLYNVVRQKSEESDRLREAIIKHCPDQAVIDFWKRDFLKSYREADLAAPRHKLLRLISGGAISRMLSQTESRLNLSTVMNESQILLVDLSQLGSGSREFLGSFLLTLFLVSAMNRSSQQKEERKPFSVFADEAHLFVSADALENFMAQARKFKVNLVLAHQYLKQFKTFQVDALLTAGSTLIGRVDRNDAGILSRDMGKISADDITSLPPFEMVGRVGTSVSRFQILPEHPSPDRDAARSIVEQSHDKYYVRPAQLTRKLHSSASGQNRWEELFAKYAHADLSFDQLEE